MRVEEIYQKLPDGWLSIEEAELLWNYARETSGDILEIGCYLGRSAVLLAHLDRNVHCVDPFKGFDTGDPSGGSIYQKFIENTRGHKNIVLHKLPIEEFIPGKVGFVYCDGDHSYWGTVRQIRKAIQCSPDYIAVDDCNDDGDGFWVKYAATELLGEWVERVGKLAIFKL